MIKPKRNILVERPKPDMNPQFVAIHVSNEGYRDLVNQYAYERFNSKDTFLSKDGRRSIISADKLDGYLVVNKCYDVEEVCQFFENLDPTYVLSEP